MSTPNTGSDVQFWTFLNWNYITLYYLLFSEFNSLDFTTQSRFLTALRKKDFENIVGKGENAGKQHFSPFPTMFFEKMFSIFGLLFHVFCHLQMLSIWTSLKFSTFPTVFSIFYPFQTNFNFSVTFILSPASAFNLDQSKILSFGKELRKLSWKKLSLLTNNCGRLINRSLTLSPTNKPPKNETLNVNKPKKNPLQKLFLHKNVLLLRKFAENIETQF